MELMVLRRPPSLLPERPSKTALTRCRSRLQILNSSRCIDLTRFWAPCRGAAKIPSHRLQKRWLRRKQSLLIPALMAMWR